MPNLVKPLSTVHIRQKRLRDTNTLSSAIKTDPVHKCERSETLFLTTGMSKGGGADFGRSEGPALLHAPQIFRLCDLPVIH